MATDIIDGLFGLTAEQEQFQRQRMLDQAAMQYAKMAPFERATAGMFRGGAQLADVGAGMLGMQNPAIVEAQRRESALAGIDMSNPQSIMKRAEMVQDPRMKMRLQMLAQQVAEKQQEIELKKAHAAYYMGQGRQASGTGTDPMVRLADKLAIERRTATTDAASLGLSGIEAETYINARVRKMEDEWRRVTGKEVQSTERADLYLTPGTNVNALLKQLKSDELVAIESGNETRLKDIREAIGLISELPPSKADALEEQERAKLRGREDPAIKGAGAEGEKTGAGIGESNLKRYATVESARIALPKLDALEKQLQSGDTITGLAADFRLLVNKLESALGGKEAAKRATSTEVANAMMGSDVFGFIQQLGIGARGMDTPAERDFMREVLAGRIALEKDTLIQMTKLRKKALEDAVSVWNDDTESGRLDRFYQGSGLPKSRIEIGKPTQSRRIKFGDLNGR